MNIKGKVKGTGDYTGHQIVLSFTVRVVVNADEDQFIWRFAQERIDILNDGRFGFELPNKDQLKNGLKLDVLAPDGEVLKTQEFNIDTINENDEITLEVNAKLNFEIPKNEDPSFGRRAKIAGRVIDAAGKQKISNRQVILWASPITSNGAGSGVAEREVVAATSTDMEGYFSDEYR